MIYKEPFKIDYEFNRILDDNNIILINLDAVLLECNRDKEIFQSICELAIDILQGMNSEGRLK